MDGVPKTRWNFQSKTRSRENSFNERGVYRHRYVALGVHLNFTSLLEAQISLKIILLSLPMAILARTYGYVCCLRSQ